MLEDLEYQPEAFRVDEIAFRDKFSKTGEISWRWCQKTNAYKCKEWTVENIVAGDQLKGRQGQGTGLSSWRWGGDHGKCHLHLIAGGRL